MKNLILLLIFLTLVFSNSLFAGDIEITISGPDAPTDGSVYTVTGGEPPYAWGISCGNISWPWPGGVVSGISNCCGKGTIYVKDTCGYKAEKTVRMPKGQWYRLEFCNNGLSGSCGGSNNRCNTVSGATRTVVNGATWALGGYWGGPGCPVYDCSPGVQTSFYPGCAPYANSSYKEEWQCP